MKRNNSACLVRIPKLGKCVQIQIDAIPDKAWRAIVEAGLRQVICRGLPKLAPRSSFKSDAAYKRAVSEVIEQGIANILEDKV